MSLTSAYLHTRRQASREQYDPASFPSLSTASASSNVRSSDARREPANTAPAPQRRIFAAPWAIGNEWTRDQIWLGRHFDETLALEGLRLLNPSYIFHALWNCSLLRLLSSRCKFRTSPIQVNLRTFYETSSFLHGFCCSPILNVSRYFVSKNYLAVFKLFPQRMPMRPGYGFFRLFMVVAQVLLGLSLFYVRSSLTGFWKL